MTVSQRKITSVGPLSVALVYQGLSGDKAS